MSDEKGTAFGDLTSTINQVFDNMAMRAYSYLQPTDVTPEEVARLCVRASDLDLLRTARRMTRLRIYVKLPLKLEGFEDRPSTWAMRFSVDGNAGNLPLQPDYAYDTDNISELPDSAPLDVVQRVSERMSLMFQMCTRIAVTKKAFERLNKIGGSAINVRYHLPGIVPVLREAVTIAERNVGYANRKEMRAKQRELNMATRYASSLINTRAEHFRPLPTALAPAVKLANETIAQMGVMGDHAVGSLPVRVTLVPNELIVRHPAWLEGEGLVPVEGHAG
jgi:hypothetical protein